MPLGSTTPMPGVPVLSTPMHHRTYAGQRTPTVWGSVGRVRRRCRPARPSPRRAVHLPDVHLPRAAERRDRGPVPCRGRGLFAIREFAKSGAAQNECKLSQMVCTGLCRVTALALLTDPGTELPRGLRTRLLRYLADCWWRPGPLSPAATIPCFLHLTVFFLHRTLRLATDPLGTSFFGHRTFFGGPICFRCFMSAEVEYHSARYPFGGAGGFSRPPTLPLPYLQVCLKQIPWSPALFPTKEIYLWPDKQPRPSFSISSES